MVTSSPSTSFSTCLWNLCHITNRPCLAYHSTTKQTNCVPRKQSAEHTRNSPFWLLQVWGVYQNESMKRTAVNLAYHAHCLAPRVVLAPTRVVGSTQYHPRLTLLAGTDAVARGDSHADTVFAGTRQYTRETKWNLGQLAGCGADASGNSDGSMCAASY